MAFDLNPIALTSEPLLRAIAAGGWTNMRELAEAAGRHKNNLARDLERLAAQALVTVDPVVLTDAGRDQLAALDRAADPSAGAGAGPVVLHGDMEPHPLNPRKDFETGAAEEDLDELRTSIVKKGLLQPILIRPREGQPGKWWIIAGERRWRAIGQAIFDGDWDEDRPVPVTTRDVTDGEHLLLALIENLQRSNMSAIEEAAGFALAISEYGQTTDGLANATGKSQRFIQQRLALLKLPQEDQDRMRLPKDHPDHLSFKAARAMTQTPRAPEPGAMEWKPDPLPEILPQRTREPGSPPAGATAPEPSPTHEAPSFGKGLTDRMALAFVEIVDKAEKQPAADPALASESYTPCQTVPVEGVLGDLVARGAVGFRQRGNETFVRPRLHTTNARAWLDEIGFDAHRDAVLFEFRARVFGAIQADQHHAEGTYATGWLNPSPNAPASTGKTLAEVLTTWQNGAPYERLFDRHKPTLTASRLAPDLPWAEWRDRPLSDFIEADRLETFCLGNLPAGRDDYPDALIEVAPLKGGAGWVYGAGYSTSNAAHHERLRMVSDGKEAFASRETAIAAGVDLIRSSLGSMNKNRLPVRTYDWTVAMLSPATRPPAKNASGEPEQGELIAPTPEEAEAIAAAKRLNMRRDTSRAEVRHLTAAAYQMIDQADFMTLPATRRDCMNLALDLLRANEPAQALIALAGAVVEYRDGATRPTGFRNAECDSALTMRHRIRSLEEL